MSCYLFCATYLEGDVCLRTDFGRRQLNIGILPNKVDGDEFLALLASEASQAAADWFMVHYNALSPILAFIVVTRAGL